MNPDTEFQAMLAGGHLNSLGRTVEVVEIVLADQPRLADWPTRYDKSYD